MTVDPYNAEELATITGEVGAEVLRGILRYPSATGGWQLGELDLDEYIARYRVQKLVLIIAPVGQAALETYTCGSCGFGYAEYGDCPKCGRKIEEAARETVVTGEERDVIDQVADLPDDAENRPNWTLNLAQRVVRSAQGCAWHPYRQPRPSLRIQVVTLTVCRYASRQSVEHGPGYLVYGEVRPFRAVVCYLTCTLSAS